MAKQKQSDDSVSAEAVEQAAKGGQDAGGNNPASQDMGKVLGDSQGYRTADRAADDLGEVLKRTEEATEEGQEVDPEAPAKLKKLGDDADIQDAARAMATLLSDQGSEDEPEGDDTEDVDPEDRPEREHQFDTEDLDTPVPLKVRGETIYKPLKEVISDAQKGIDYTKKTQELAEERKGVRQVRSELDDLANQFGKRIEVMDNVFSALPADAQQALADVYVQAQQELQAVKSHELQERFVEEHAAMVEALGWDSDDDVSEGMTKLKAGAAEYGFSEDEIDSVVDHRLIVMLSDAVATQEQRKNAGKAERKLRKTRKKSTNLQPSTRHVSDGNKRSKITKAQKAARKKLRQTGNIDDAAAALSGLFTDSGG